MPEPKQPQKPETEKPGVGRPMKRDDKEMPDERPVDRPEREEQQPESD